MRVGWGSCCGQGWREGQSSSRNFGQADWDLTFLGDFRGLHDPALASGREISQPLVLSGPIKL